MLAEVKKEMQLLILGLDNAGKTTIVKFLSAEDNTNTMPTQGLNAKTVMFGKTKI